MGTNSGASAGSVALAFLSGALLGAVTAIMLAPAMLDEQVKTYEI
jgi:hypothetical protein